MRTSRVVPAASSSFGSAQTRALFPRKMSLLAAVLDWGNARPRLQQVEAMLSAPPGRTPDGRQVRSFPYGLMGFGLRVVRARDRRSGLFVDERRKIYAVGDVRLDNRDELRGLLSNFAEALDSDIALIAAAYCRWGHEMVERLAGDFAFAVWDGDKQELYAARDPFGVRSLVYHQGRGTVLLATEPAQFLPLHEFDRTVDDQTVADFLSWSYAHYGQTFFRSARALRPGHFLCAKANDLREREYFHPPERLIRYARTADYEQEFRSICTLAVKDRLDSEYPIVSHLSGGLDSSSIACLADRIYAETKNGRPPFHLVSAVFPGKAHDESAFIQEITRRVQFEAHRWDGNRASGRDFSDPPLSMPGASVAFNGGSTGDIEIAQRIGARTILSGDPGDFVTGENGLFNELLSRRKLATVARLLLDGASPSERKIRRVLLRYALREEVPVLLAAWRFAKRRQPSRPPDWFRPEMDRMWIGPEFWSPPLLGIGLNRLQQRSWDYLRWTRLSWAIDRSGIYAASGGTEMLFPLLDVRLVRFVLSVPVDHRVPGKLGRWLHRQAMVGVMPESIRLRSSKPTFNRAVVDWGHCSLSAIREMLGGAVWHSDRFVNRDRLEALTTELGTRQPDRRDRDGWVGVRAVAHLETWLRAVFLYPRTEETATMPDVRSAPTEAESGSEPRAASVGGYVPPKLVPVGNVRDLLATTPGVSDDGTPGTPAIAGT